MASIARVFVVITSLNLRLGGIALREFNKADGENDGLHRS